MIELKNLASHSHAEGSLVLPSEQELSTVSGGNPLAIGAAALAGGAASAALQAAKNQSDKALSAGLIGGGVGAATTAGLILAAPAIVASPVVGAAGAAFLGIAVGATAADFILDTQAGSVPLEGR
jgi:hypothetical protein